MKSLWESKCESISLPVKFSINKEAQYISCKLVRTALNIYKNSSVCRFTLIQTTPRGVLSFLLNLPRPESSPDVLSFCYHTVEQCRIEHYNFLHKLSLPNYPTFYKFYREILQIDTIFLQKII